MRVITVGRGPDSDVVIDDYRVSRIHLQLVQDNHGNYSVVDLNSANGTFVNGQRITGQHYLQKSDIVKIGDTPLLWYGIITEEPASIEPKAEPKRSTWYVGGAVILLLMLAGGGTYWKISHDRNIIIEEAKLKAEEEAAAKEKAEDLDRFYTWKINAEMVKSDGGDIQTFLNSMQSIADKYVEDIELQEIITKLQQ